MNDQAESRRCAAIVAAKKLYSRSIFNPSHYWVDGEQIWALCSVSEDPFSDAREYKPRLLGWCGEVIEKGKSCA